MFGRAHEFCGYRVDHRVGKNDDHAFAVALALAGIMSVPAGFTLESTSFTKSYFTGLYRVGAEPEPARAPSRADVHQLHPHERREVNGPSEMSERRRVAWANGEPVTFHGDEPTGMCLGCGIRGVPTSVQAEHLAECPRGVARGGFR